MGQNQAWGVQNNGGGGGGTNIYNSNGELQANRTVDLSDKYLQFGDPINDYGIAFGNLTSLGASLDQFYAKFKLFTVDGDEGVYIYGANEGLFLTAGDDREAPEGDIVLTRQAGGRMISALTVYDEDASEQKARVEVIYDKATGYSRAQLGSYSEFDGSEKNYFRAEKDLTQMHYIHTTNGDEIHFNLSDDGVVVQFNSVDKFKIDYDGNLISAQVATLNFADDTAAAAGGVPLNAFYHNNGAMRIRLV